MSKEYTYSMPQSFLTDKSVPVRWRVWAVINGFFIAGKEFWASNDWIAEQLICHKDSVSQGVKELEELGMMHSKRTRRSRVIYPGKGEIGGSAYLREVAPPISDRSERLSISDSISDSELGAAEDGVREELYREEEESPRPKTKPKYPNARKAFAWFPSPQKSWEINRTELAHGELLFDRGEDKVRGILRFVAKHQEEDFFPKVTKPSDLERKWNDIASYKPV